MSVFVAPVRVFIEDVPEDVFNSIEDAPGDVWILEDYIQDVRFDK